MTLIIDHQNKIINFRNEGHFESKSFGDTVDSCEETMTMLLAGTYEFEKPIVWIDSKKGVQVICLPRAPPFEVYYCQNSSGDKIFTREYLEAIEFVGHVSIDLEAKNFFLMNSVFPPRRTYVKEVKRIMPGEILWGPSLSETSNVGESRQSTDEELTYERFIFLFDSFIKSKVEGKDVAVLLSGGVDSTSVAVAARKYAKSLRAYTMSYTPAMRGVFADLEKARETATALGIEMTICEVDLTKYSLDRYKQFINVMPMSSGLTAGFDTAMEYIKKDNLESVLTGQNADWLYWLSATSRATLSRGGLAALFRRSFLTRQYFSHVLSKKNGKFPFGSSRYSVVFYLWEWLGAVIFSLAKRRVFFPPCNAAELVHAFQLRPDVTVFLTKNERLPAQITEFYSPQELYTALMRVVIEKNMMLPDSQIIRRAAENHGLKVVFPYSSEILIDFWIGKIPNISELFAHKKMISRYVRDHLPSYYKRKEGDPKGGRADSLEEQKWARFILESTPWLLSIYKRNKALPEAITDYRKLTYTINCLWVECIEEQIKLKSSTRSLQG